MRNLFLLALSIFFFSSCSNDDTILSSTNLSNESADLKPTLRTIDFIYKGKSYSAEYYEKGDSVIILDYETQVIYNNLRNNEDKFIVVSEDNKITYFDNESEYLEIEKTKPQLRSTETAPYIKVVVRLYKNIDPLFYSTTTMLIEKTYTRLSTYLERGEENLSSFPDLRVYNHNDNISMAKVSLYLGNMTPDFNFRGEAALWMYEHINYGGESCAAYAATAWNDSQYGPMKLGEEKGETTQIVLKAFKKYNGDSFDDRISSLKIQLTYTNMNEKTRRESANNNRDSSSSGTSTSGGRTGEGSRESGSIRS